MSIDKLISELDRENRDFKKISECGKSTLNDYMGVAKAYIDLMHSIKDNTVKVDFICKILFELINSIQGLNKLITVIESPDVSKDKLDNFAGLILKGEQVIDSLIEEFENIA